MDAQMIHQTFTGLAAQLNEHELQNIQE